MHITDVQLRSDQELVGFLGEDPEKAFSAIYQRYSSRLYNAAYNLLRNKEVCEDLVQELFVDLWFRKESLDIVHLRSYLYRSISNKALMVLRSGKVTLDLEMVELLMDESVTDGHVIHKEINESLDKGIAHLPEKCRNVFILSRKSQLTHKEIASQLNISVKTVENHLTKALKYLKISLGDFLFLLILPLPVIFL